MWEQLTQKLRSILLQNTELADVFDWENADFSGDPVVTITPSTNDSEYSTTTENRRIYAFKIRLYVMRTAPRTAQDCELITRRITDTILDDLDKNFTLTGVTLPTGYTMLFMEAAPSSWGYFERENLYRVAEIDLNIHVDVDINLIS